MLKRWILEQSPLEELTAAYNAQLHCPRCGSEEFEPAPAVWSEEGLEYDKIFCHSCFHEFAVEELGYGFTETAQLLFNQAIRLLADWQEEESLDSASEAQELLEQELSKELEPEPLKLLIGVHSLKAMLFAMRKPKERKAKAAYEHAEAAMSLACRLAEMSPSMESYFILAMSCFDLSRLGKGIYGAKPDRDLRNSMSLLRDLLQEAENEPETEAEEESIREEETEQEDLTELTDLIHLRMIYQIDEVSKDLMKKERVEEAEPLLHELVSLSRRFLQPKEGELYAERVLLHLRNALHRLAIIYHQKGAIDLELSTARDYLSFSSLDLYDGLKRLEQKEKETEDITYFEDDPYESYLDALFDLIADYEKLARHLIDLKEFSKARTLLEEMALVLEDKPAIKLKELSGDDFFSAFDAFDLYEIKARLYAAMKEEEKSEIFYQKASGVLKELLQHSESDVDIMIAFEDSQKLLKYAQDFSYAEKELEVLQLRETILEKWSETAALPASKTKEALQERLAYLKYENDRKLADFYIRLKQPQKALEYYQRALSFLQDARSGRYQKLAKYGDFKNKEKIQQEISLLETAMETLGKESKTCL